MFIRFPGDKKEGGILDPNDQRESGGGGAAILDPGVN